MKKVIKRLLLVTFLLTGLTYFFIYWWFHNSIDHILTYKQKAWLKSEIEKTPELTENIYKTMENHFPDFYSENSWNYKFKNILGIKTSPCQCTEIYLPFIPGEKSAYKKNSWVPGQQYDLLIKLYIEQNFSQKKCFTFNMNISEFGSNTQGIKEAARLYYNKQLAELSEKEILGLYVIQKGPTHFNPFYNRENLEEAIMHILEKN